MTTPRGVALGRFVGRIVTTADRSCVVRPSARASLRPSPSRPAGLSFTLESSRFERRGRFVRAHSSTNTPLFDYTALVASTSEIKALATPAKVDAVSQQDASSVVVDARSIDGKIGIKVSWHPTSAHVAMCAPFGRAEKGTNLSFGEVATNALRGKVLLDARCGTPWERAMSLSFGERPGGEVEYELICEIMGAQSNAFLIDAQRERAVVACGYQPGEGRAGVRRLATGKAYAPPPTAPGIDPPEGVKDGARGFASVVQGVASTRDEGERSRLDACVARAFRGVSPALARTLARCAGLPDGAIVGDVTDSEWTALCDEFNSWIESVSNGNVPSLDRASWCEDFGQLLLHVNGKGTPLPPRADDLSVAGGPIGELFGGVYGDAGDKDVFDRERSRILQAVRARLKKLISKEAGFRKQLEAASGHEKIQELADALMAYAHNYVAGASSLEGQDFITGEPATFAVDPEKGPVGTAEALYKKTRKLRRTADAVEPLIEENAREMEYLQQVEFSIVEVNSYRSRDDLLFIEEICLELEDGGFMKPTGKGAEAKKRAQTNGQVGKKGKHQPKSGKAARKQELMSAVRVYTAPSGKEVYCGRNSRGNEAVSLHLGKESDVWFHVRGAPGAHVILRQQPGDHASDEDMQFAADVAAFHSKVRTGGKVDVSYCSPKHVRKPSGARLGMVTISNESVLIARPDSVANVCESGMD
jgi:predicted ribosome quality control (RQC) complex YloA/Tae2 family protein